MASLKWGRALGVAALAACCVLALSACSSSSNGSSSVAATVGGKEITEQQVTDYIQNFRSQQGLDDEDTWGKWLAQSQLEPSKVRQDVIDYFAEDIIIAKAAEERGITVSDDDINAQVDQMKSNYDSDDAWKEALSQAGTSEEEYRNRIRTAMLKQELTTSVTSDTPRAGDDEVLQFVQMYAQSFSGAKRSSHILFSADDTDKAQQVLDQINSGAISFEDAAKQYSTDTASAQNGGDVGWDLLNQFVAPYTEALGKLDKGQVSDLVTSDYGIHIIKCTDVFTAPEEVTSLDQVPSELVDYVRQMTNSSKASQAYQTWYEDYKNNNADYKVNDMPSGLPYDVDMSKYQQEVQDATTTLPGADGQSADGSDAAAADASTNASSDSSDQTAPSEQPATTEQPAEQTDTSASQPKE